MSIGDNIKLVRANIARACTASGRSVEDCELLCVAKFVDTDRIAEAIAAGQAAFGENRAQEVTEKLNFYKQHRARVHFIGQFQSNKIKYLCGKVDLIQSVDRSELCVQLNDYALRHDLCQDILVQVNIGDEAQKGGVSEKELPFLMDKLAVMQGLTVKGLMCVPPAVYGDEVRPFFSRMRELLYTARKLHPELELNTLSMGMSHDYQEAIAEGATIVRVGTAIFGARTAR